MTSISHLVGWCFFDGKKVVSCIWWARNSCRRCRRTPETFTGRGRSRWRREWSIRSPMTISWRGAGMSRRSAAAVRRSSRGRCMPPRWVFICTLRSAGTRWSGQWTALRAAFSGGRLPWGGQWERIWFYTLLFMVAGHSVHLCILHFIGWHQEADNYSSAMTLLRQQPACRGSDLYYVICPEFCRLLRIY